MSSSLRDDVQTRSRSASDTKQFETEVLKYVPPTEEEITWYNKAVGSGSEEIFEEPNAMLKMMKLTLNTSLSTQSMMSNVNERMSNITTRMSNIEERQMVLEQYSRKDVVIMTGFPQQEEETQENLQRQVLGLLNAVKPPRYQDFTLKDFSAIHRNGKGKNNRPPSITIKFLRLHEKDLFFAKPVKQLIRNKRVNIFHSLCQAMIDEMKGIERHDLVNYVYYSGPARHFVVKLNCGDYLNYIRNYNEFVTNLSTHICDGSG